MTALPDLSFNVEEEDASHLFREKKTVDQNKEKNFSKDIKTQFLQLHYWVLIIFCTYA